MNFRCFDPLLFQSSVTFQCSVFDLTPVRRVLVPESQCHEHKCLLSNLTFAERMQQLRTLQKWVIGDYLISFRYNVAWWRHHMETFSVLLALSAGNSPVTGESPVNSPHKGQWRRALVFSLICAWINGWVNNRETVDLRWHRAHYGVIVMLQSVARNTEALKGHRVVWKIEICYLIRMT